MSLLLTLDNRETHLINVLKSIDVEFDTANLDVGDIQFRDTQSGAIILVIERKTLTDFESSIKDGRYREQKLRLAKASNAVHKMYLVEGTWRDITSMTGGEKIKGAIINTMFRDGINIFMMSSLDDTANFIVGCKKRFESSLDTYTKPAEAKQDVDYACSLSTSKKANMTPATFATVALAQIPGLSIASARAVLERYRNSLGFLVQHYNINDAKAISISSKRKLGEKMAQRISEFIASEKMI
jgi:ERCC4-type nuclease